MGPIYSRRPLPKTHYTDSENTYTGPATCGVRGQRGFQPYVTDLEYRVDCGRCNRILDARVEKQQEEGSQS